MIVTDPIHDSSFHAICDHVERDIIRDRETHQDYGVYQVRGTWFAAPIWYIHLYGFTAARVWRPRRRGAAI